MVVFETRTNYHIVTIASPFQFEKMYRFVIGTQTPTGAMLASDARWVSYDGAIERIDIIKKHRPQDVRRRHIMAETWCYERLLNETCRSRNVGGGRDGCETPITSPTFDTGIARPSAAHRHLRIRIPQGMRSVGREGRDRADVL